ncbi:MAG: hypothetical protein WBK47_08590 [Acetomicrobium sp.]|jgi:hypothetical protein
MNKILKILKGKSLKGLGKLTKIAWIFNVKPEETADPDIISVTGIPSSIFMISGASVPTPEISESVIKIEVLQPLKGSVNVEENL